MANGKRHLKERKGLRRVKKKRKGRPTEVCKWKNIDGVRTRVCKPIKQNTTKRNL